MTKQQLLKKARVLVRDIAHCTLCIHDSDDKSLQTEIISQFLMGESGSFFFFAPNSLSKNNELLETANFTVLVTKTPFSNGDYAQVINLTGNTKSTNSKKILDRYLLFFPELPSEKGAAQHSEQKSLVEFIPKQIQYTDEEHKGSEINIEDWRSIEPLTEYEASIIDHMHTDHLDALAAISEYLFQQPVKEKHVKMLKCYAEGFHILINTDVRSEIRFVPFKNIVDEKHTVRAEMVSLTKKIRKQIQKQRL